MRTKIFLFAGLVIAATPIQAEGLFSRGASAALGVATRSVEKAVEIGSERRASANPERAAIVRGKAKIGLAALGKVDEKLFNRAGIDIERADKMRDSLDALNSLR